jgi:hypothetical protein
MPVVHLVGEIPDLVIQVAKAIKGQSACLKPVLATVFLDVPGNTMACGINVHKTGNYIFPKAAIQNTARQYFPAPFREDDWCGNFSHCTYYSIVQGLDCVKR